MEFSTIAILAAFPIIGSAIGYTLGLASYSVINTFMITFISPILSKFLKKDIANFKVTVGGVKLNIGELIIAIVDFIMILLLILFLLRYLFRGVIHEVIKSKSKNSREIVNLLQQIVTWRLPMKP